MMRVAMGDISAEPSMEEILSSIKRIIAEEGDGGPPRARRPQRAPVMPAAPEPDEVLELSEPIPVLRAPEPAPRVAEPARRAPDPVSSPEPTAEPVAEPIVSQAAAAASRGALDALSRAVVKPESVPGPQADGPLEAAVREMLRPMLRDWLDAKLPEIVEAMVAREIERITGSPKT